MAIDIIAVKTVVAHMGSNVPVLRGADQLAIDALAKMQDGEVTHLKITRPRNVRHHRKAFALLNLVFEAQEQYATLEDMLDDIKIALGHCRIFYGMGGAQRIIPSSISFSAMDQTSFEEFYRRMVDLILTKILPHANRADLEQRIFEILGERGPENV